MSLDSNAAVARGHFVQLPPDQAVIAHELARVWPKCLAYERIFFAVWGHNVPDSAMTTMRTQITKLRHALKPLGYGIVPVWGEGYRLVDQSKPIKAHPMAVIDAGSDRSKCTPGGPT